MIHSSVPMLLIAMGISYYINTYRHKSIVSNALSNTFIYQFLLPIIVLAEGFNNRKKSLGIYKKDIMSLGVVTPLINFFVFGGLLIGAQALGLKYLGLSPDYKQSNTILFAIAITLSTVDIHGATAPLHKFHNGRLEKILFSASTFNNNICLVLVMTFERMVNTNDYSEGSAVSNFLKVGALSIVMGVAIGAFSTWVLKVQPYLSGNSLLETLYVMIGAYLAYALAHLPFFQLSGDVSIFFYGLMMSHYNKFNMSTETFKNIGLTLNMMMLLAEMICFVYIGMSIEDTFLDHFQNIWIAVSVIFIMMVSRGICFGIVAILDWKNDHHRIKGKEWIAALSSGIVKGPLSYIFANIIVASNIPCLDRKNQEVYKKVVPLFIVQLSVVMTLFLGCPFNYLVMSCTVKEEHGEGADIERKTELLEDIKKLYLENKWELDLSKPRALIYIDEFVMKPWLIRNYHQRKKYIYELKASFERESKLYMHGGDDHGGHGDHGHGGHGGHGDHGHEGHGGHEKHGGHGGHRGHGHEAHGSHHENHTHSEKGHPYHNQDDKKADQKDNKGHQDRYKGDSAHHSEKDTHHDQDEHTLKDKHQTDHKANSRKNKRLHHSGTTITPNQHEQEADAYSSAIELGPAHSKGASQRSALKSDSSHSLKSKSDASALPIPAGKLHAYRF